MVVFSPLVGMRQSLQVGQTWRGITVEKVGDCLSACVVEAKVEAFEKVTTTAGTFDAYRVGISIVLARQIGAVLPGFAGGAQGTISYWYAPQVKRIVKYTARSRGGANLFTDMDSQLVAFRLAGQAAVGTLPEASR